MLLAKPVEWGSIKPLPLLLGLFAAAMAIQLVPLPPSLWYGLQGREKYDAVVTVLVGTDHWHPLALSPDRAWNSLITLLTPLGVMLGFAALDDRQRHLLLWPLLGLVAFSMVLGVAQIATGMNSPLYWYRVSGHGQMIGLLANRNHQGALLALALPLLRAWTMFPVTHRRIARTRTIIGLAAAGIIILYVLVLGSRAGLLLMVAGLLAAYLVQPSIGTGKLSRRQRWLMMGGLAVGIAAIVVIALGTDRAVTLGRVVDDDLGAEGRLAALPTLLHIMSKDWLFGTGFGSFVPVYASYEPDALLKTSYFNNAHNDLIELIITGGLPAFLVLIGFLIWWGHRSWLVLSSRSRTLDPYRTLQRASAFAILILMLASTTDYPLRAPLMGGVFTLLCCWLASKSDLEQSNA